MGKVASSIDSTQSLESPLDRLGRTLALNHFNISVSDSQDSAENYAKAENVLKRSKFNSSDFQYERVIFFVGAGVSIGANSKLFENGVGTLLSLERALGLYERLRVREKNNFRSYDSLDFEVLPVTTRDSVIIEDRERFKYIASKVKKRVISKLGEFLSKDGLDFELRIEILNAFYTPHEVHQELRRRVNFSAIPSMTCELIAHLLKHRFIDVVVDTNFDELLTSSIKDEIGGSDYHEIVTVDDVKEFNEYIYDDNRLKVPIYVKPHGTVSSSKTMKYTRNHYVELSLELRNLLIDLFGGKIGKGGRVAASHFVVVGHGLNDDLIEIIADTISEVKSGQGRVINFNFYVIGKNVSAINALKELGEVPNLQVKVYQIAENSHDYPAVLDSLYLKLQECFKPPYTPGALARHKFICEALNKWCTENLLREVTNTNVDLNERLRHLFEGKLLCHFVYDLLKYRTKIPLGEFFEGRMYGYFVKMVQIRGKPGSRSMIDYLKEFLKDTSCDIVLGESTIHFNYSGKSMAMIREMLVEALVKMQAIAGDVDKLTTILREAAIKRENCSVPVEINSRQWGRNSVLFTPTLAKDKIYTNTGLVYQSFRFVNELRHAWKVEQILISTRSGQMVQNLFDSPESRMIIKNAEDFRIVLRSNDCAGGLEIFKEPVVREQTRVFAGNEHQMFVIKYIPVRGGEITSRALYYHLQTSRNRVNPVLIRSNKGSSDLEILEKIFQRYWDDESGAENVLTLPPSNSNSPSTSQ